MTSSCKIPFSMFRQTMLIAVSAGGISKVLELSWWDVRQWRNSGGWGWVGGGPCPLKGSVGNFGDGKEGEKEGKKKEEVEKRRGKEKKKGKGKERRGKVRKIRGKEGRERR